MGIGFCWLPLAARGGTPGTLVCRVAVVPGAPGGVPWDPGFPGYGVGVLLVQLVHAYWPEASDEPIR